MKNNSRVKLILNEPASGVGLQGLGEFLILLRGIYAAVLSRPAIFDIPNPSKSPVELRKAFLKLVTSENPLSINKWFSARRGKDHLTVEKITRNSPLSVYLAHVNWTAVVAIIIAGGSVNLGNMSVKIPPLIKTIKLIKSLFNSAIKKSSISYGISHLKVKLSQQEMNELLKRAKGSGGFQTFFIEWQTRLNQNSRELELYPIDIQKIIKHGNEPEKGGFQRRIQKIFGRHFNLSRRIN